MSTWALLQLVFDIFGALGLFVIVMRMSRAPKDDPRLSRGLQLLQSKIAVLEDLSDRTENQVNQMMTLLDQKAKEVQAKIQLAERSVQEIKISMQNSLEVAKIFQDKIPHEEIIERQNSIKYVQAARMAHQGHSVEEIASKVSLPKGEIEFIAKVNRDQLMFNEEHLPEWAKNTPPQNVQQNGPAGAEGEEVENFATTSLAGVAMTQQMPESSLGHLNFTETPEDQASRFRAEIEIAERQRLVENLSRLQFEMQNLDMQLARENQGRGGTSTLEPARVPADSIRNLQQIGEEFRKAVVEANEPKATFPPLAQLAQMIPQMFNADGVHPALSQVPTTPTVAAPLVATKTAQSGKPAAPVSTEPVIKKVVFPRINSIGG